ncbi:MAG: sugar ABC transporter permease [Eubacterium sp.]|nr:sugar ABC transporter permease [Eubacterium sp.]
MVGKTIKKWWPIFVLPTLAAFIIGFLWPFIWGIYLSFCKFTTVKDVQFVGFTNYTKIFIDDTFTRAFWLTVLFAIISSVLINVLAFLIALILTKGFKGTNVFRTIFFMPNLIGGIVLGYIWQTLLNGLLSKWGQPLLQLSAVNGFWGMIILLLWQQIGYMMIIYIAGLNNVSPDLIEAAQIDGATPSQILFKIKLPMIMPSITICTFLTLTNGFKLFDQNLSLTGGDPGKKSQLLALNIYDTFYGRSGPQWKGIGQAKAVLFFIIVVAIALVQLRATTSKEVQQ